MSTGVSLRFEIDSSEPLTGRVRGDRGVAAFAGWLGLMSAVERMLDESAPATPAHEPASDPAGTRP